MWVRVCDPGDNDIGWWAASSGAHSFFTLETNYVPGKPLMPILMRYPILQNTIYMNLYSSLQRRNQGDFCLWKSNNIACWKKISKARITWNLQEKVENKNCRKEKRELKIIRGWMDWWSIFSIYSKLFQMVQLFKCLQ